jgi:hypothetical protein
MAGYMATFTFVLHVSLLLYHKFSEINASIALEMGRCFGNSDVRDDFVGLSGAYRIIGRRDWWWWHYYC